ncbi:MAG: ABC transporter substrate-binding protein [Candidatus Sericytochromatia bacterium]|nr:ABC transporter substrate-binding protein [Candidatus Sericytochromatia bacterium]
MALTRLRAWLPGQTLIARLLAIPVLVTGAFVMSVSQAAAGPTENLRDLPDIRKAGALRVGADPTSGLPYFARPDAASEPVGFEADLARALGRRLGLKITFLPTAWRVLPQALVEGQIDVVLNAQEIRSGGGMRFTRPYYLASQAIVTREEVRGLYTLADLAGRQVAVTTGSVGMAVASRLKPPAKLVECPDTDGPFNALREKRAEAVVLESAMVQAWLARQPRGFRLVGRPILPRPYGMAVRSSSKQLLAALDAELAALKHHGAHRRLLKTHHLWDAIQGEAIAAPAR